MKNDADLTPQPPSEGVFIQYRTNDCVVLSTTCKCSDPDDTLELCIERDDYGIITVHQTVLAKTDFWTRRVGNPPDSGNAFYNRVNLFLVDMYNSLRRKLSVTYDVWVKGSATYHQYTVMDRQQALNYAAAIETMVKEYDAMKAADTSTAVPVVDSVETPAQN